MLPHQKSASLSFYTKRSQRNAEPATCPALRVTGPSREAQTELARSVADQLTALRMATVVVDECEEAKHASARNGGLFTSAHSTRALASMAARFASEGCVVIVVSGCHDSVATEIFLARNRSFVSERYGSQCKHVVLAEGSYANAESAERVVRAILHASSPMRDSAIPFRRCA